MKTWVIFMKIMIIGDGKIGSVLAEQLSKEKHEVTLVDRSGVRLDQSNNELDVMVVEGDGASRDVQLEAGADQADLVIACTGADELNLLCCLIGKKLGARHTIARVRNPMYVEELNLIKDDLGLSMAINPEEACATEMARVLRFPSAIKIDTFARGHVEILKTGVTAGSPLDGMALKDIGRFRANVLICAVERGERDVIIPSGEFQLKAGDRISVVASPQEAQRFFRQVGVAKTRVRQVMLIGGGRVSYYLAQMLIGADVHVKIIENNSQRSEQLAQMLPEAAVICADGANQEILEAEGLNETDALVTLTGIDELDLLVVLHGVHSVDQVVADGADEQLGAAIAVHILQAIANLIDILDNTGQIVQAPILVVHGLQALEQGIEVVVQQITIQGLSRHHGDFFRGGGQGLNRRCCSLGGCFAGLGGFVTALRAGAHGQHQGQRTNQCNKFFHKFATFL
ncbi:MAG: Trk system potassium transporter TrkA [Clostridiales bacterium]|nr:Trk system potassium transporter TrkA [Clostridiales bacterium]